jgi:hypothetical protein
MIGDQMTPIDAIQEFYRLKNEYESDYFKRYLKPILKSKNSKREKRLNYSKLPKNVCINCQRNVGTLFSIVVDKKESVKRYKVKCGDTSEPCALDIEIQYGIREPMDATIRDGMSTIDWLKLEIIKQKNNAIFFNRDVTTDFETLTEELKTETENIGFMVETNFLRNENPEKQALLKRLTRDFGKSYLVPFKMHVERFEETDDPSELKHAVEMYRREIVPKLKEIREMKYNVNSVEYNADTNKFHLRQFPHSLESNEFYFKKDDQLVKLMRDKGAGTKSKTKTKAKTIRIKPLAKNKTIRLMANEVVDNEVDANEVDANEVVDNEVDDVDKSAEL